MKRLVVGFALVVAACSGAAATPSRNVAAFDAAHAAEGWMAQCTNSSTSDTYFCKQVTFSGFAADGTTLIVPTTFDSDDTEKADFVCGLLARAHFQEDRTTSFGYEKVIVRDKSGTQLATCAIV